MFAKFQLSAVAVASAAVLAVLPGTSAAQQSLTVTSWGGAYTVSQVESMHKPFAALKKINVVSQDYNGDLAEIAAQVKTGNVKWDLVDVEPAEAMKGCEEGLFEKFPCDVVYGMHNMPGFPAGHFAIRTGAMLASSDSWEVVFKGTGGHGAMPDRGTDPTFVAAQFIVAVQGIVGRNVPSSQAAVLSVGHIAAGTPGSPNVIP